jgi:hypothetical protein
MEGAKAGSSALTFSESSWLIFYASEFGWSILFCTVCRDNINSCFFLFSFNSLNHSLFENEFIFAPMVKGGDLHLLLGYDTH